MNPFKNARIISDNYDGRLYCSQPINENGKRIGRGDPNYVMNRSALMDFSECPSRWIRSRAGDDSTKSTDWGSLVDCLLFEPCKLTERFSLQPRDYPTEKGDTKPWSNNANFCKAWNAAEEKAGRIIIKEADLLEAELAIKRIVECDVVTPVLQESRSQVYATAEYHDRTGLVIPFKTLMDLVPNDGDAIWDLKTSKSANPSTWARAVHQFGYHAQAAIELDIYNAATKQKRERFFHLVQENFQPYEVCVMELDPSFISLGRTIYKQALEEYAYALSTGHYRDFAQLQPSSRCVGGIPIVSPESWMIEKTSTVDPDWMSDEKQTN